MTRAISLHAVSKSYTRGARVVDRLSLDIRPGEFLVLLGPSGCGKSTVLRMIAGLEEIDEGELLLDGEHANDLLPADRRMAMVFQNFALYPSMTSRDNIGFPLRIEAPGDDPRPRVEATARMLGIEELLDRFPGQLSGGERQRVAMGRAIARRPTAFLMDEPLSNLDAKLRNHLRAEISGLTRTLGVTTVYVTHDQAEAMSLGDRVAVLRGGVLQQVGTPRTVYALPRNVFVAAFIGTPRINLLRGVVRAPLDGAMTISLGKQFLRLPEPLSLDHQLLRVQQGREVIVGLRSEAVRIGDRAAARPGETHITGLVEHVEFQGHEMLVHFNTGSRPAVVPDLEAPRPVPPGRRRRREGGTVLERLRGRVDALRAGPVVTVEEPDGPAEEPAPPEGRLPGDLIVRTTPDLALRHGMQVPLLVDIAHLFVFDQHGDRICPAPARLPDLEE
ncbi:ABC transporter ATP-binding protein [Streptomyces sp. SS1-1]|uniref:ABC transporter ATP-binding protein n=1 Tax=Streptomyces sp. SS1-1 TaxID=2651869 RepID=UPI0012508823|nr:ABC transporter ATP-binding protein [Streptomyces sp. SS1-1]KAB2971918.1 ABC transporter ATP-binding protein [Streptomyces sp. SS1-1]